MWLLCGKEKHVCASLNPSNLGNNVTGTLQYKLECWLDIQFSIQGTMCTDFLLLPRAANTKLLWACSYAAIPPSSCSSDNTSVRVGMKSNSRDSAAYQGKHSNKLSVSLMWVLMNATCCQLRIKALKHCQVYAVTNPHQYCLLIYSCTSESSRANGCTWQNCVLVRTICTSIIVWNKTSWSTRGILLEQWFCRATVSVTNRALLATFSSARPPSHNSFTVSILLNVHDSFNICIS